ncbi:MAG: aldo/keto reductase [Oscillospiraceae bacterium]|nr:aldo/keto reductase [Oscillospiraceae bacterium]
METINFVLGTMTFGESLFGEDAAQMIQRFGELGYEELDTAYVYNGGQSEELIGAALKASGDTHFKIATKVNPRITGRLDGDAVMMQFTESLRRLQTDHVDTLYLHFPDANTPVESALEACAKLHSEGKFKELGLSNFPAWLVVDVYHRCKQKGWMLPTVYEGLYNPLSRRAESELNMVIDTFGLRFYAYNPLAGGMLTNKYSTMDAAPADGRFTHRPNYKNRYWKQSYFDAIGVLKTLCTKYEINIIEATYRWMAYHSMLNAQRGDALIIGASKISQMEQNVAAIQGGALPEELVQAFSAAWETTKADAPAYFRFYDPNSNT